MELPKTAGMSSTRIFSPNPKYKTTVEIPPRSNRSAELRKKYIHTSPIPYSRSSTSVNNFYYDPKRGIWSEYHDSYVPDHLGSPKYGGSLPRLNSSSLKRPSAKSPSSTLRSPTRFSSSVSLSSHPFYADDPNSGNSPVFKKAMAHSPSDWLEGRLNELPCVNMGRQLPCVHGKHKTPSCAKRGRRARSTTPGRCAGRHSSCDSNLMEDVEMGHDSTDYPEGYSDSSREVSPNKSPQRVSRDSESMRRSPIKTSPSQNNSEVGASTNRDRDSSYDDEPKKKFNFISGPEKAESTKHSDSFRETGMKIDERNRFGFGTYSSTAKSSGREDSTPSRSPKKTPSIKIQAPDENPSSPTKMGVQSSSGSPEKGKVGSESGDQIPQREPSRSSTNPIGADNENIKENNPENPNNVLDPDKQEPQPTQNNIVRVNTFTLAPNVGKQPLRINVEQLGSKQGSHKDEVDEWNSSDLLKIKPNGTTTDKNNPDRDGFGHQTTDVGGGTNPGASITTQTSLDSGSGNTSKRSGRQLIGDAEESSVIKEDTLPKYGNVRANKHFYEGKTQGTQTSAIPPNQISISSLSYKNSNSLDNSREIKPNPRLSTQTQNNAQDVHRSNYPGFSSRPVAVANSEELSSNNADAEDSSDGYTSEELSPNAQFSPLFSKSTNPNASAETTKSTQKFFDPYDPRNLVVKDLDENENPKFQKSSTNGGSDTKQHETNDSNYNFVKAQKSKDVEYKEDSSEVPSGNFTQNQKRDEKGLNKSPNGKQSNDNESPNGKQSNDNESRIEVDEDDSGYDLPSTLFQPDDRNFKKLSLTETGANLENSAYPPAYFGSQLETPDWSEDGPYSEVYGRDQALKSPVMRSEMKVYLNYLDEEVYTSECEEPNARSEDEISGDSQFEYNLRINESSPNARVVNQNRQYSSEQTVSRTSRNDSDRNAYDENRTPASNEDDRLRNLTNPAAHRSRKSPEFSKHASHNDRVDSRDGNKAVTQRYGSRNESSPSPQRGPGTGRIHSSQSRQNGITGEKPENSRTGSQAKQNRASDEHNSTLTEERRMRSETERSNHQNMSGNLFQTSDTGRTITPVDGKLFGRRAGRFVPDMEEEFVIENEDQFLQSLNAQTDLSHIFDFDESEVGTRIEREIAPPKADFEIVKNMFDTRLIYADNDLTREKKRKASCARISKGLVDKLREYFDSRERRARKELDFYKLVHGDLKHRHDNMKEWDPLLWSPFDELFVQRWQYRYHVRESRYRRSRSISQGRTPIDLDYIERCKYRYIVRAPNEYQGFLSLGNSLINTPASSYADIRRSRDFELETASLSGMNISRSMSNARVMDYYSHQRLFSDPVWIDPASMVGQSDIYEEYDSLPAPVDERKKQDSKDQPDRINEKDLPDQSNNESSIHAQSRLNNMRVNRGSLNEGTRENLYGSYSEIYSRERDDQLKRRSREKIERKSNRETNQNEQRMREFFKTPKSQSSKTQSSKSQSQSEKQYFESNASSERRFEHNNSTKITNYSRSGNQINQSPKTEKRIQSPKQREVSKSPANRTSPSSIENSFKTFNVTTNHGVSNNYRYEDDDEDAISVNTVKSMSRPSSAGSRVTSRYERNLEKAAHQSSSKQSSPGFSKGDKNVSKQRGFVNRGIEAFEKKVQENQERAKNESYRKTTKRAVEKTQTVNRNMETKSEHADPKQPSQEKRKHEEIRRPELPKSTRNDLQQFVNEELYDQTSHLTSFYSPKAYSSQSLNELSDFQNHEKRRSPSGKSEVFLVTGIPGSRTVKYDPYHEDHSTLLKHEQEMFYAHNPKTGRTVQIDGPDSMSEVSNNEPAVLIKTIQRTTEERLIHIESMDDLNKIEIDDSIRDTANNLADKRQSHMHRELDDLKAQRYRRFVPKEDKNSAKLKSYDSLLFGPGFESSSTVLTPEKSRSLDELNVLSQNLRSENHLRKREKAEHSQTEEDLESPLYQHNSSSVENIADVQSNQFKQSSQQSKAQTEQNNHEEAAHFWTPTSPQKSPGRERVIKKAGTLSKNPSSRSPYSSTNSLIFVNSPPENKQYSNYLQMKPVEEPKDPYLNSDPNEVKAEVLFTFKPFSPRELEAKRGEVITLISRVDSNWVEARSGNKTGFIPITYIRVLERSSTKDEKAPNPSEKSAVENPVKQQKTQELQSQQVYQNLGNAQIHSTKYQASHSTRSWTVTKTEQRSENVTSEVNRGQKVTAVVQTPVKKGRVMFDFDAQTEVELDLRKNQIVNIRKQVDENWFDGYIGQRRGIFPIAYVEIISDGKDQLPDAAKKGQTQHSELLYKRNTTLVNGVHPISSGEGNKSSNGVKHANDQQRPPHTHQYFRVAYPFAPQHADELQLVKDDVILVVEQCSDGWFAGRSMQSGQFGLFPGNHVEKIPQ